MFVKLLGIGDNPVDMEPNVVSTRVDPSVGSGLPVSLGEDVRVSVPGPMPLLEDPPKLVGRVILEKVNSPS